MSEKLGGCNNRFVFTLVKRVEICHEHKKLNMQETINLGVSFTRMKITCGKTNKELMRECLLLEVRK